MFKKGVFSDQLKDKFLGHIIQKFNISPSLVKEFGSKRAVNITIDKMIQDLQLNSDSLLILERIGDYISRGNEEEYLSELLPRVLEFIGSGIKTEALSLFQPLSHYLGKNMCSLENGIPNVVSKEFIGESSPNDGEEL